MLAGGAATPHPQLVASLEMEAALAKSPAVSLVLDPARRVLAIRARTVVLDRVTIDGIEYRVYYEEAGQGIPRPGKTETKL